MAKTEELVLAIPLGGTIPVPGGVIDMPSPSVKDVMYRVTVKRIKKVSWHRNRLRQGYPIIGIQLTVEGTRVPIGKGTQPAPTLVT